MKNNQKGFSLVEVLIIVVTVGLVGAVGWLVFDRQKSTSNDTGNSKTQAVTNDETADWEEVKNSANYFSYKFPKTDACENLVNDTSKTGGTYITSVGCMVGIQASASPFSLSIAVAGTKEDQPNFGDTQMQGNTYYSLTSKKAVKKGGTTGTRWEYSPGDDRSAKVIYYYFRHRDMGYVMTINQGGYMGKTFDVTQRGEKIFETFKFLN